VRPTQGCSRHRRNGQTAINEASNWAFSSEYLCYVCMGSAWVVHGLRDVCMFLGAHTDARHAHGQVEDDEAYSFTHSHSHLASHNGRGSSKSASLRASHDGFEADSLLQDQLAAEMQK
jgi:hypothetical protein